MAHAVGGDTLQEQAYGYSVPISFTRDFRQRMRWFKQGCQYRDLNTATFSLTRDSELNKNDSEEFLNRF